MSAFQRILFPVDFSLDCDSVVPTVRRMIETWNAEVTLLHVIESRQWLGRKQELARLMAQMRTLACDGLRAPRSLYRIERGSAADRILEYARANRSDLIVIPAGGSSTVYGKPLGSVADQIVSEAPCSVWIDWGSARSRATSGMFARRVCCALELTGFEDLVLRTASQVAAQLEAELSVVHPVLTAPRGRLAPLWNPAGRELLLAQARSRLEALRSRYFPAAEITVELGSGRSVVNREIQMQNAGLLITSNWREAILAAESECPVLRVAAAAASVAVPVEEMPLQYAFAGRSA